MKNQSHTSTLTTLGTEEAAAHVEEVKPSTALRNMEVQVEVEIYNRDESDPEDGSVISDEVEEEATEMVPKPTEQDATLEDEAGEGDSANPAKEPDNKAAGNECANRSTSGPHDGPVSYDMDVSAEGRKNKYPFNKKSVQVIQRAGKAFILDAFDLLTETQKKSDICFHIDTPLRDSSTTQGGEWPSSTWYPDTSEQGAAEQDLSWFVKLCCPYFPRTHAVADFPYPEKLRLMDHIKLCEQSTIPPKWGIYVEYPLPTKKVCMQWPRVSAT